MIEIKPFDLNNVSKHYKWNNDKELSFYDSEYPHEYESFEVFLARIKEVINPLNKTAHLFEIHTKDDGELIGIVDVHAIDNYHSRCYVQCTIGDESHRNKGIGQEAMKWVLNYCFEELNMAKVGAIAFDFNKRWINLLKKLHFQQEGVLRSHVLKGEKYHDKIMFGILQKEYREMKYKKEFSAVAAE